MGLMGSMEPFNFEKVLCKRVLRNTISKVFNAFHNDHVVFDLGHRKRLRKTVENAQLALYFTVSNAFIFGIQS